MHLAVVIIHFTYLTWSTSEGGSAVQKLPGPGKISGLSPTQDHDQILSSIPYLGVGPRVAVVGKLGLTFQAGKNARHQMNRTWTDTEGLRTFLRKGLRLVPETAQCGDL